MHIKHKTFVPILLNLKMKWLLKIKKIIYDTNWSGWLARNDDNEKQFCDGNSFSAAFILLE